MKKILRLGTRGSPLALIQAEDVRTKLLAAHAHLRFETDIEIVPIRTSGDWRPSQKERTFLETGGDKGLFTKEI
jgi:hydroxymethylbilane synthase